MITFREVATFGSSGTVISVPFTVNAGEMLFLTFHGQPSASVVSVTGLGLTWTRVASTIVDSAGPGASLMELWTATTPTTQTGNVTVTLSSSTAGAIVGCQAASGASGLGAAVHNPNDGSHPNPLTLTVAPLANADSAVFSVAALESSVSGQAVALASGTTLDSHSGFTTSYGFPDIVAAGFIVNNATIAWNFSGGGTYRSGGIAVEVKAATVVVAPSVHHPRGRFLGDSAWFARITDRGGKNVLMESAVSNVQMSRKRSDTGTATVTIAQSAIPASAVGPLATLRTWQYELHLWRDDSSIVPPFVGVISDKVTWTPTRLIISARDLSAWLERRNVGNVSHSGDIADLIAVLVEDAMHPDPVPAIATDARATGVHQTRAWKATDDERTNDAIRDLAGLGCDWTMSERTMRLRATDDGVVDGAVPSSAVAGVLTSEAFADNPEPQAELDGLSVATQVVVKGQIKDSSVRAVAGGPDRDIGLVVQTMQDAAISSNEDVSDVAREFAAEMSTEALTLSGSLTPRAGVTFSDLVPGNLFLVDLDLGWVEIGEVLRLASLDVQPTKQAEQTQVTLTRIASVIRPPRPRQPAVRWRL